MALERETFSLYDVHIDLSPAARIDKYRAHQPCGTSLHPAKLKDAGKEFEAVAKITTMPSKEGQEKLLQCAEINRSLHDHPNIIKVYGVQRKDNRFALLMEKALCSSRDIISPSTPEMCKQRDEVLSKITMKELFHHACKALAYTHSKTDDVNDNISHRDIKPENILIVPHQRDGTVVGKLADYDSSKQLEVDKRVAISTNVTTEEYKDPVMDEKKAEGLQVVIVDHLFGDIYSLGVSGFEFLANANGKHLFEGKNARETASKMLNHDRSNLLNADMDELAKLLLYTMTQPKAHQRINANEVETHIYFRNDDFHIRSLNSINEALIDLDDSTESEAIRDAFNKSFFMVFQNEWQKLPFVAPETITGPKAKYTGLLESFLRHLRNMMQHTEQHKETLKKHYTVEEVNAVVVLQQSLKCTPRALVHCYWFAKRYLSLSFNNLFPENCALAYEEWMEEERKKIGDRMASLYKNVCQKPGEAVSPKDTDEALDEAFDETCKQIRQALDKTERNFKDLKKKVADWEKKRSQLTNTVAKKKENNRPEKEIADFQQQLDQHLASKPDRKWMLEVRESMRDPKKLQNDKSKQHITW